MTRLADQIAQSRRALAEDIEAFIVRHDLNPSRFGRMAMGDPKFVYELRKGRRMEPETMDELRTFMKAYQPPKLRRARGNDRVAA